MPRCSRPGRAAPQNSGARWARAEVPRAALGPAKRHEPAPADGKNARRPRGRAGGRGRRGLSEEAGGAHPRPSLAHQRGEPAGRCGLGRELPVLPVPPFAHPFSFRLSGGLETQVSEWRPHLGFSGSPPCGASVISAAPVLGARGEETPLVSFPPTQSVWGGKVEDWLCFLH